MGDALDHSKHLRSIHFALIVVSLVIVATGIVGRDDRFALALRESAAIAAIADLVGPVEDSVTGAIRVAVKRHPRGTEIQTFANSWSRFAFEDHDSWSGGARFRADFLPRFLWGSAIGIFPEHEFSTTGKHALADIDKLNGRLQTLGDFVVFWNSLAELSDFHALVALDVDEAFRDPIPEKQSGKDLGEDLCRLFVENRQKFKFIVKEYNDFALFSESGPAGIVEIPPRSCRKETSDRTTGRSSAYSVAIQRGRGATLVDPDYQVPAQHLALAVNAQRHHLERYDGVFPIQRGVFKVTFPVLEGLINEFGNLNLKSLTIRAGDDGFSGLRRALTDLRRLSSRQVSLFGISAPGILLTTWGSVILSGFMLYLAVHLRAFSRNYGEELASGDQPPWIALYTNELIARILVVATAIILPVSVAIWLAWLRFPETNLLALSGYAATFAAILSGLFLAKALRDFWRGLPH